MKVNLDRVGARIPKSGFIWVGLSILLLLGVLSSVVDLTGLSDHQRKEALAEQQRVIIDAKTGATSHADKPALTKKEPAKKQETKADDAQSFDVGEDGEVSAPTERPSEPVTASNEEMDPSFAADDAPALATDPATSNIAKVERTKNSLVTAPAPEVAEITPHGVLPKRGEGKNVTPAMIYSRSYTRKDDMATLHLVVMGLGFGSDVFALASDLPPEVSFSFSPYGEALSDAVEAARNAGHEAWIGLPVQSANYPQDDPGPLGLIATLPPEVFEARLKKSLLGVVGAVGVILPPDETLSGVPKLFSDFLETLYKHGLIVFSTHPERRVVDLSSDKKIQKILGKSDMILDEVPNAAVIKSKLAGLMDTTKERGHMVVLMHARPQTLILVRDWLKTVQREDVELAPLSAAILRPPKMLTPDDVEPKKESAGGEGKPAGGSH